MHELTPNAELRSACCCLPAAISRLTHVLSAVFRHHVTYYQRMSVAVTNDLVLAVSIHGFVVLSPNSFKYNYYLKKVSKKRTVFMESGINHYLAFSNFDKNTQ